MGKKLYVGNLPFSIDDAALKDHFAQVGAVESATVISDRATGRSKGFGFVEMGTDELAKQAIEKFHQTDFDGRTITVAEARPQEPRENRDSRGPRDRRPGGFGGGGGGGGRGRDRW
jgi:RNA recognition motif-containing protein